MLKQIKPRKMLALPTLILIRLNPEHEEVKQGIIQKCNQSPVSMAPNILGITVYSCTSQNTLSKGISISGFRYPLYNQGRLYQAPSFLLFFTLFLTSALPMYNSDIHRAYCAHSSGTVGHLDSHFGTFSFLTAPACSLKKKYHHQEGEPMVPTSFYSQY